MESNLVGYWDFNEGGGEQVTEKISGTIQDIDYVFNKKNQDMLYKLASDPLWREGVLGTSLLFDGYSTFIEDDAYKLPVEQVTISLWLAPRAYEWGDGGLLSAFVSQANSKRKDGIVFGNYRHGTWSLQLGVGDDLESQWIEIWDDGHPLAKNEWAYVTATYDTKEARARLYLNGKLINEMIYENYRGKSIRTSEEIFTIGKSNQNHKLAGIFNHNIYNGMIDELKIYDAVLDEEAVRSQYNTYLTINKGMHPTLKYESIQLNPQVYDGDRYRPQYHAIPGGHWMNEPHAPFYFNGKYHLFFQHNPHGPFWHQIHWGHWVSDDMIHWELLKEALSPTAGDITPDGVWTGGATYDANGEPLLFFTAGNDGKKPNQSVAIARPKDITDPKLIEWCIYPKVIAKQEEGQGDFGEFRDPFVWKDKEEQKWYMIVGTGTNTNNGGTALTYSSKDLYTWQYHGNLFETDHSKYPELGEHWEMPLLLPLFTPDGDVNKDMFIISPHGEGASVEVYYWLGKFDPKKMCFIPEHEEPRRIDFGESTFTGPNGFVDPKTGRTILSTIAQGRGRSPLEEYYSGWAHTGGMPMSLSLDEQTHQLRIAPIEEVENAREKTLLHLNNVTLVEANNVLETIGGDLLEIKLEIRNINAEEYGIAVRNHPKNKEYTNITYQSSKEVLVVDRTKSSKIKTKQSKNSGHLKLTEDDTLKLHILLDRSLLEVYGNNSMSITSRIYPTLKESDGLKVITDGEVEILSLSVYQMGSVYSEKTVKPYYAQ